MYTIGKIIYGIPLTKWLADFCLEHGEDYDGIFELMYDGGVCEGPCGYFGIELDDFNCLNSQLISGLQLEVTPDQLVQYDKMVQESPEWLRPYLKNPQRHIVFYTS